MNTTIIFTVRNRRISSDTKSIDLIGDNMDYTAVFEFDEDMASERIKTARFIKDDVQEERILDDNNSCQIPPELLKKGYISVGVYTDEKSTTPCFLQINRSIRETDYPVKDPEPDVYRQLLEKIEKLKGLREIELRADEKNIQWRYVGEEEWKQLISFSDITVSPEEIKQAVKEYLKDNPLEETDPTVPDWAKEPQKPTYTAEEVGALPTSKLPEAIDVALAQAKASGEFNGKDGKDGAPGEKGDPGETTYVENPYDDTQLKNDIGQLKEDLANVEKSTICKNIFGGVPNVYYPCNIPSGTDVTVSTEDGSNFEAGTVFNLYSSDKTRKDYWNLGNQSNRTIKTNADISYVTLSKTVNANVQIEIGNKSTEYQEHFLDVKMLNKKLDNIGEDDIVNALINRAKIICGYVEKNTINGFLNALDGSIKLDNIASQVTDFVKVIPNEILLYSGKGSTSAANVCFYDKKFAFISSVNTLQYGAFEINVPSETAYARFASRANEDGEIAELIVNIKTKPMYKNNLTGKKWYACGDSFTEGAYIFNDLKLADRWLEDGKYAGKLKSYPYYIGNRTNCDVYNIALSGSTLAYVSSEPKNYSFSSDYGTEEPSYNNYKSVPIDADYITLWFGINDNGYNVPIGNDDDTTNTTFKGAYNIVLKHFVENCKKAKIGIIVSNNMPQAYVDATIKMANRWGIKSLDLNSDEVPLMQATLRNVCDEAKANAINKFALSQSNMHPNYYAHEFESKFIEHWLLSL